MSQKTIEVLVGLFVLVGILGMLFLALKSANLFGSGGGNYLLTARFDNIGGLKAQAPVRSAGVLVGRVTDIVLDAKTFQGVVSFQVDLRFQFPTDSAAKIMTSGLLGDQYLGIEPGGNDKYLTAGGTITHTQSAVVLENLIGQFLTSTAADAAARPASGVAK